MRRLPVTVLLLVALSASAACIPPEPDLDEIVQYDPEETVMGEIQERGRLRIGVPIDRPPFTEFGSNLGSLVADALGVQWTPVPLESDVILDAAEEQQVDISFPVVTITERLARHYAVTDPYYVGHQRLLVAKDSSIEQVTNLDGVVCQFIDYRTGVNVAEINPKARPIAPTNTFECLSGLQTGDVQAVTASDWVLFPMLFEGRGLKIVGDELTTEAYGAVIETGATAWADFVNQVFAEAGVEGDWQRFHDRAFKRLRASAELTDPVTYPDLTAEEAAALFPSDI